MNNKNFFNHNNWLKNSDKLGLNILNIRGISIYLDKKGYITQLSHIDSTKFMN